MIHAVLVDLDGTLWDRDRAFRTLVDVQHRTFPELAAIPRERYVIREGVNATRKPCSSD